MTVEPGRGEFGDVQDGKFGAVPAASIVWDPSRGNYRGKMARKGQKMSRRVCGGGQNGQECHEMASMVMKWAVGS